MDVAHNLIFIASCYIYSRLLMILFWNKWYLLKKEFFWKTILVVIYSKMLLHSLIPAIFEHFKSVSRANIKFQTCMPVCFEQRIKSVLNINIIAVPNNIRYNVNKWTLSQKCKISYSVKTTTCSYTIWLQIYLHEIKKIVLVGKMSERSDIILHILLIHF